VRENDHHENIFIVEDNIDAELWHGELTRPRRKWSEKIIVDKVITTKCNKVPMLHSQF
jgi:hypothetical protein